MLQRPVETIESLARAGYITPMDQSQQKPTQKSNLSGSLQALALIGVLLAVVVGVFLLGEGRNATSPIITTGGITSAGQSASAPPTASSAVSPGGPGISANPSPVNAPAGMTGLALDPNQPYDLTAEPLQFDSAAQALEAVLRAAATDDGTMLDRFANLSPDTPWLKELSSSLIDLVKNPSTDREKRQYLANILGISGQPENTKFLFEELAKATTDEQIETFATAIDLTGGPAETTQFLGTVLDSDNANVRTAALSALTNQDSLEAVQLVYNHTLKSGNPELGLDQGVGFSEMFPDDKTMPFFTDVLSKGDEYSILAVRPLARTGESGISKILDVTLQHKGGPFEEKVVSQLALDLDEETLEYLTKVKNDASNSARAELAGKVIDKLKQLEAEAEAESGSEVESMVMGEEG